MGDREYGVTKEYRRREEGKEMNQGPRPYLPPLATAL
jgi:hypothetical protein